MSWNGLVKDKKLIKCGSEVINCGGTKYLASWIEPMAYGSEKFVIEAIPKVKEWQSTFPNIPFEHTMIYALWGAVNTAVVYKYDEMAKYPDYWNSIDETYHDKWGDCEDSAIALTSASSRVSLKGDVKLAIGYYTLGGWYGHAFCIYSSPYFKKDVVLETTWDDYVTPNRAILLESSFYHPTVVGNDKIPFKQVCNCTHCQEMMDYLTTGKKLAYRTSKAEPILKDQLKEIEVKKSWLRKILRR